MIRFIVAFIAAFFTGAAFGTIASAADTRLPLIVDNYSSQSTAQSTIAFTLTPIPIDTSAITPATTAITPLPCTATVIPTLTSIPTDIATQTSTQTSTPSPTDTATATPTDTTTPASTETPTPTPTDTATVTSTETPTPTPTPTETVTTPHYDDFDDNERDQSKWMLYIVGNGPVVSEEEGQVVVTLPHTSTQPLDVNFFDGGYFSQCPLRGDFDVQVDYELLTWPALSAVRVGLMLDRDQVAHKIHHVSRIGFGQNEGPPTQKEVYYDGILDSAMIPTNHMSGTLRITRTGPNFVGYYLENDDWIPIVATPETTDDLYFGFSIWSDDTIFADQTTVVAFDNMMINSGEIVCPDD